MVRGVSHFFAPKGLRSSEPQATPGVKESLIDLALKGQRSCTDPLDCARTALPFQGGEIVITLFPGRCPGLKAALPLRGEEDRCVNLAKRNAL